MVVVQLVRTAIVEYLHKTGVDYMAPNSFFLMDERMNGCFVFNVGSMAVKKNTPARMMCWIKIEGF
jgi:hypothetical protein